MGFFDKIRQASMQVQPEPEEVTTEHDVTRNGRIINVTKTTKVVNGTKVESVTEGEPYDIYKARNTLARIKKLKLSRDKAAKANIEKLLNGRSRHAGIGTIELKGEKYICMLEGVAVGTAHRADMPRIAQAYGIKDNQLPPSMPCKVVLKMYDESGAWSGATIL